MFGPNISGTLSTGGYGTRDVAIGAFSIKSYGGDILATTQVGAFKTLQVAAFRASASASVFGASSTVQPPSIALLPLIKF